MSDFTKEELEQIETTLVWLRADFKVDYVELHQKLQSLIDNYCEHETQPVFTTDGCVIPVCMKCGKCTN